MPGLRLDKALSLLAHSGQRPPTGEPGSAEWLQQLIDALVDLSSRDGLTGLANRRAFELALLREIDRVARSGEPALLLMLDIDHFKRVNDTHGHGVGDEVLRRFAAVALSGLRDTDVLARWGGEEFLLLLNDTTPEQANIGLERVRELLTDAQLSTEVPELRATFSAGLTAYDCNEPLDTCIERADRALYEAKAQGRNRTVVHHHPRSTEAGTATGGTQATPLPTGSAESASLVSAALLDANSPAHLPVLD
jgi:diguanylate cyclase (GGDEF)-like protein